ncbi:DUF4224 domain-containing protein [Burkholderia sp. SIMBA_043]|uniref:DUF4224 domain-containing protein n=1 Tax=Burkholderia TaxID=32008 RepID=UPI0005D9344D|nr:DUF4224 domain-containing protein [Burkholderia vietnamiensis]AJY05695.1 hypothetical protein AK36_1248 [Burkholderia vietnamiensis LMG 10929]AVR16501.1 DUF4224 domain-containing protein [Burkholderia vietnamiensis]KVM54342.1 hypothetical protein WJ57_13255 [Burkholderia vietnamiensis]KVS02478.1 hypothetical protein WK30_14815 [Burkholderia vietnamiensis]UBI25471.1 DUF4224 domain-containing protein [Burkholderia vietnamiensis]
MDVETFLSVEEVEVLTGRKLKSKQIDALRRMGIAFYVNAAGRPIVARSTIEGKRENAPRAVRRGWEPRVIIG